MTTQPDRPHWHFGLWLLVIALTALGGPMSAQSRQSSSRGVTVYADLNFSGQSASFRDDMPNLVSSGWNDKISSIRIPSGETWEVCQDVDYRNQCQVLSGDVADLRGLGWNDRISSLRRVNDGRQWGGAFGNSVGITVYADSNFKGQSATFRDDTPNLALDRWNDKISSIRIPGGEAWEVCQDADYRSQCQVLSGDVADLRGMGWNDRISSLRRVNNGRRSGGAFDNRAIGITVYADRNYSGQSASFRDDMPNLVSSGWNDKISSIRIPNGETWEVCQDVDYRNQCQVLSSDVADLRVMGWNDRISSLRAVNSSGYRDRPSDKVFQYNVEQSLLFYDRGGFTGASTIVTARSSNVGLSARQGSVQLRGGGSWELCDSSGRCATINQDVADVSRL
ncbi:MAG TPA: beta/gamma crystallin-related protein, partial [Gemmatimonadaceae bacterium]